MALIKEMCGKWVEVQKFVENYHPVKAPPSGNVDLLNEQTMSHCRNILQHIQKQVSLDTFLVKLPILSLQLCSVMPRDRKQKKPLRKLPEIVLEEDSSSNN